jgi:hypothetical protein
MTQNGCRCGARGALEARQPPARGSVASPSKLLALVWVGAPRAAALGGGRRAGPPWWWSRWGAPGGLRGRRYAGRAARTMVG